MVCYGMVVCGSMKYCLDWNSKSRMGGAFGASGARVAYCQSCPKCQEWNGGQEELNSDGGGFGQLEKLERVALLTSLLPGNDIRHFCQTDFNIITMAPYWCNPDKWSDHMSPMQASGLQGGRAQSHRYHHHHHHHHRYHHHHHHH